MMDPGFVEVDRQQQLAEERTDAAHQRTLLAHERTYSAWARTSLAAIATGFAVYKLAGDTGPVWLVRSVGALFIFTGALMCLLGYWAYQRAIRRYTTNAVPSIPIWLIGVMSAALAVGGGAVLALVLLD